MTTRTNRRDQAGSVLLGILLLAVLITSVTLGYARHAVLAGGNSDASVAVQAAEGAADSGIAWAKQALLASGAGSASLALSDEAGVTVDLAAAGANLHTLTIASSARGHSQAMLGTVETYATTGGELPSLTDAALLAARLHGSVTNVSGAQSYSNTTLTGLIYLRHGASLTLTNCIVAGTIISEAARSSTGWSASDATTITLAGTVVLESDAAFTGCSIIAPDARVDGTGAAVQIRGAIVCDSLVLGGWGAVHGPIASTGSLRLSANIDLPGSGREPRTWPAALQTGAEGIVRISFPRASATGGEQDAIENFTFPAQRHARGADLGD